MDTVKDNLAAVEERILNACKKAGRNREDVRLISVSKTKPVGLLMEAYDAGARDFGENKVQEILQKAPLMPDDVRWHMIGHLQTNKVRQLIPHAAMIHSIDSEKLARAVSAEAEKAGRRIPVLVEVNMAGEESKFGLSPEETEDFVRSIAPLPGIAVKGLMTIAPFTEDPETNRPYFAALKELCLDIDRKSINNVDMYELSMGMTGDFEVAVEEGATFIRVGTGIFGERIYASQGQ
ncbi:MAG: YggS family pyridoxal phosphate-dependent enzyme [Lachnospiraceae bacterium]|nr:YggS family pyridoxal phosphate-dependent enzyme [Lachnospiraceae bacterium]